MADKKKELTDKEKNDIVFRNAVVDRLSSLEKRVPKKPKKKRKRITIKGLKGLQGLQRL
tara:strand:+ start:19823 stop:19999 length:177 start_codon:yes stop_codon:yes gene_type:complete